MKPLEAFYKHSEMKDGHLNKCKDCTKEDVSAHKELNKDKIQEYDRNRPNHKERTKANNVRMKWLKSSDPDKYNKQIVESNKKWVSDNPLKRNAHSAVSNAIRDGKLQKISICENWGYDDKVQAHHESYEEVDWLNVVWLCIQCHNKRHKVLNKYRREGGQLPSQ